uniref:Uncharacterized protein n=1 Tax=Meloidogyne hapla TaxID=6305 RepID=A0A1I8B013_MELHA
MSENKDNNKQNEKQAEEEKQEKIIVKNKKDKCKCMGEIKESLEGIKEAIMLLVEKKEEEDTTNEEDSTSGSQEQNNNNMNFHGHHQNRGHHQFRGGRGGYRGRRPARQHFEPYYNNYNFRRSGSMGPQRHY